VFGSASNAVENPKSARDTRTTLLQGEDRSTPNGRATRRDHWVRARGQPIAAALADLRKGGGGKCSRGLLHTVDGVLDAETAEVGEAEQCFGADDHGEIEPQLCQ
jgi:hypothetical protein